MIACLLPASLCGTTLPRKDKTGKQQVVKLAFALYKYFPFGGLQKDMLSVAQACAEKGHQVTIFCRSWEGPYPEHEKIEVNILPNKKNFWNKSNHKRDKQFIKRFTETARKYQADLVVGFNKMPGLDIYYAADTCFKAKVFQERPGLYRWLPRYRYYINTETAIFRLGAPTRILAISEPAIREYQQFYQTEISRFFLLPPGISRDRINPDGERLNRLHQELELPESHRVVLMVGSGFRTKGLDRSIQALASLPPPLKQTTHLVIAGEDRPEIFRQQAQTLGITQQVHFLGGRKDIPALLKSADVLIHPAYRENTGTVLLEAAVSGLPVIATENCGYAAYIAKHDLGLVLSNPFEQSAFNAALLEALNNTSRQQQWRDNCYRFAREADIYNLADRALSVIEQVAAEKQPGQKGLSA
jgi:UDP-glucose:(heptosyl)LPS alpha-1,3-glucosyltransferase